MSVQVRTSAPFHCADLAIVSVTVPASAKQGLRVTANVQVKNYGTLDAVFPEGKEFLSVRFSGTYNTPTYGVALEHVMKAGPGGIKIPAGGAGNWSLDVVDPYTDLPVAGD